MFDHRPANVAEVAAPVASNVLEEGFHALKLLVALRTLSIVLLDLVVVGHQMALLVVQTVKHLAAKDAR